MNLLTLITEAQRLAGRVDSNFVARTRRWINEAQEEWALETPWPTLVREETFLADGNRSMYLPPRVRVFLWAGDKSQARPLPMLKHWDREFPAQFFGNSSGAAFTIRPMGISPVFRQPAAIGPLSFRTTASDTFSVNVSGLTLDTTVSGSSEQYYQTREAVTITSDGVFTTTTPFYRITALGKDDFTPGDLVARDSSSNVLARVNRDTYRSEYRQIDFLNTPGAGTEFVVQYLAGPEPLIDNSQVPAPALDCEYLIWYAAGMIHEAMGEAQQSQIKLARAKEIMARRIHKEKGFGDQDWRALPEPGYWTDEDQYLP